MVEVKWVTRKDGATFRVGDRVAHLQDYRIRTGEIVDVDPEWTGCRAIGRRSDRVFVTTPRCRVKWDGDYPGYGTTWVDAGNLVGIEGDSFYISSRSHPSEFAELKRTLRRSIAGYREDQTVVNTIRVKRDIVVKELRRITTSRDVFDWEMREGVEPGDVLVYEGEGQRLVLAVIETKVTGEALHPDDV